MTDKYKANRYHKQQPTGGSVFTYSCYATKPSLNPQNFILNPSRDPKHTKYAFWGNVSKNAHDIYNTSMKF